MPILLLMFCFFTKANAQCPNWLNSVGDAQIIVAEASKYAGNLYIEKDHQKGADYYYYNSVKTATLRIALEGKSDKIKIITIIAPSVQADDLYKNYFKGYMTGCITDETETYINFKNLRVTIKDYWNKTHTAKDGKIISIFVP